MRRVGIFCSLLLPISETFIRSQAQALKRWEPILIGHAELADGLPTPGLKREIVPESTNRVLRAFRFWFWRPNPALVRKFKELNLRLVHAHFGNNATLVWPSVKAAGLPLVVTLHGQDITVNRDWWESGKAGLRGRVYPRRLLRLAKEPNVSFIAVSKAIRKRAIEYGIPKEKITVSYIGVDTEQFTPGPTPINMRRKRILFTGRMVEKKAPLLMVRAFAEVRRQVPEAELVMIGDGPLLPDAKKLAGELGVCVEFLRVCGSEEVISQLNKARLLCLPSITAKNGDAEGFGMVLLEAQACGVPVVSSASGGASEGILHGETGYAFNEEDLSALVFHIYKMLSFEKKNKDMSLRATNFVVSEFNIVTCTSMLEKRYEIHRASFRTSFPKHI